MFYCTNIGVVSKKNIYIYRNLSTILHEIIVVYANVFFFLTATFFFVYLQKIILKKIRSSDKCDFGVVDLKMNNRKKTLGFIC